MAKRKQRFDTSNESIDVVHYIGNRKKFHPHDLCNFTPLTKNQERFINSFRRGTDLLLGKAPAGCGKTFIAMYLALESVLDPATPYDKVIVVRSTVEVRSMGFLPGDLNEKLAVYEAPFEQAVKKIIPKFNDGYTHLKTLGYLEFHSTAFLRGMNFERSIIIVDEAENMDWGEISTCITRMDDDSRIIIIGDMKQSDLYRKRETSGLPRLEQVMSGMSPERAEVVEFSLEDIVRGDGLVKEFLISDYKTK